MRSPAVDTDSRLHLWRHIRAYAVPPSMISAAAARRRAGDWAGACAVSRVDVDLHLPSVTRSHGAAVAAALRADLRHLAPDLLRWHLPRIAPDGLLRPALTVGLSRYHAGDGPPLWLVVRTAPAWADAGQRLSLALWPGGPAHPGRHPHPHPDPRFRLDLHRHLWDARHALELRERSGLTAPDRACDLSRWAAEAAIVLRAEGRSAGAVEIRLGGRDRLVLRVPPDGTPPRLTAGPGRGLPVLPDAAVRELPDLALLRAGMITPERLHPLVGAALAPGVAPADQVPDQADPADPGVRVVRCRGAEHRIGLVDGVLSPLDHGAEEIRREETLAALTGTPLPCLQHLADLHRSPAGLDDIRARLVHGDTEGAVRAVELLLGPQAVLPGGPLRDELEAAARQRVTYRLYRAGLDHTAGAPDPAHQERPRSDLATYPCRGRRRRQRPHC